MEESITFRDRSHNLRRVIWLEIAVIGYNVIEFAVSIAAAILAGSVALYGFGLDSAIEAAASTAVLIHIWHLGESEDQTWEGHIAVFVGFTMILLSLVVAYEAIRKLAYGEQPDESLLGIAIAAASLLIMPAVARMEHKLAHEINSRALEAESRETTVCSWLSLALLAGLLANAVLGWWWADPVAGLIIVAFVLKEAWEALTRKELCSLD